MMEGKKPWDIRRNDRNYLVGDILVLREWNPDTKEYTGRQEIVRVDYMITELPTSVGLFLGGFVVMSVTKVKFEVTESASLR
jgi:hypothetical protein